MSILYESHCPKCLRSPGHVAINIYAFCRLLPEHHLLGSSSAACHAWAFLRPLHFWARCCPLCSIYVRGLPSPRSSRGLTYDVPFGVGLRTALLNGCRFLNLAFWTMGPQSKEKRTWDRATRGISWSTRSCMASAGTGSG